MRRTYTHANISKYFISSTTSRGMPVAQEGNPFYLTNNGRKERKKFNRGLDLHQFLRLASITSLGVCNTQLPTHCKSCVILESAALWRP